MPAKYTRERNLPNTTFHVFNRGLNKQTIFVDDADRREFRQCFKRYLSPAEYLRPNGRPYPKISEHLSVIAFCLLPNHFHLVVHQIDPGAMTDLVSRATKAYPKYFNSRHGREGPLFRPGFRSKPITDHFQLKSTIAYVHANHPVGLEYEFSSHRFFVAAPSDFPRWMDIKAGLAAFGGRQAYIEFVANRETKMLQATVWPG